MSEMGFGYYGGDLGEDPDGGDGTNQPQRVEQPEKNGLRQYLKSLEEKTKEQDKLIQGLIAAQQRNQVADVLEAKGYDRAASALYTGPPDKVDEWLTTAGALLAKRPDAPQGDGAGAGGTPTTTVPLDGQAQLQAMAQAGQGAAPPLGSDAEQAAVMAKFTDAQALTDYLSAQGNQHARYYNG